MIFLWGGWAGAKEPRSQGAINVSLVFSRHASDSMFFLNGRLGGASPFLFEGISGYLKIKGLAFRISMSRIHKHTFSPRSKSPMKHRSTPSSFTPEKQPTEFNRGPRNIIMNPPKPSKTTCRYSFGYGLDDSDKPVFLLWPERTEHNGFGLIDVESGNYHDLSKTPSIQNLGLNISMLLSALVAPETFETRRLSL